MNNMPNQSQQNQNQLPNTVRRPARAAHCPSNTPQAMPQPTAPPAQAARQPQQVARSSAQHPQAAQVPSAQRPQAAQVPSAQHPQAAQAPSVQRAQAAQAPSVQHPQAQQCPAVRQPAQAKPTQAASQSPDAPTAQVELKQRAVAVDNTATRRMAVTPPVEQQAVKKREKHDQPPKKKKHMSEGAATVLSIVKAIAYIVFVIVIAGFLSYYVIMVANDIFAFVKSDEQVSVTIPEYATINEVSNILAEAEVIIYPEVFELYAKLNHDDGKFVAGEYEVNGMMNYDELLSAFKEKVIRERVWVTIPEGYTVDEIIDLFIENGIGMVKRDDQYVAATREDYVEAVNNLELYAEYFAFVQALIGNTNEDRTYQLEGYLFPDTYEFYSDSKPSQIIYKLLNRFNNIFKESFYTRAEELGYTVDEIITLASMIEKETRLYNEFEQVSSVFHNRLRNPANFPYLESDATIMYAIHHDTGSRKEEMEAEDTTYDSPYNTYTNAGLPPGPIANPSYQAITCALYPEETNYYYFVSRKNGETIFSRTYAEHQAAIAEVKREG